ncbi:MAG TPA: hypothetical protein VFU62_00215, partial [Hanamia sp.]|nr:hypothetical protein [Hanamia sp.]
TIIGSINQKKFLFTPSDSIVQNSFVAKAISWNEIVSNYKSYAQNRLLVSLYRLFLHSCFHSSFPYEVD